MIGSTFPYKLNCSKELNGLQPMKVQQLDFTQELSGTRLRAAISALSASLNGPLYEIRLSC
jgi:hypothetical protein